MFVLLKYRHDSEIAPAFALCRKSPFEPSDEILFSLNCHPFTILFPRISYSPSFGRKSM